MGERFLHRLRAKAEDELQEKFDPRDYYDVVLQCGAVPLDVLEKLVDEYITNTKSGFHKSFGAADIGPLEHAMVPDSAFLESMTFSRWCKCCVVPGACQTATS